jgi:hypothetical protein
MFDGVDGFLTDGSYFADHEFLGRFAEVAVDGFLKEGFVFGNEIV